MSKVKEIVEICSGVRYLDSLDDGCFSLAELLKKFAKVVPLREDRAVIEEYLLAEILYYSGSVDSDMGIPFEPARTLTEQFVSEGK